MFGKFNFKNLPEGKHLIEISHIGFTSVIENIDIIGETRKDYTLTEAVVENNAVIYAAILASVKLEIHNCYFEYIFKKSIEFIQLKISTTGYETQVKKEV